MKVYEGRSVENSSVRRVGESFTNMADEQPQPNNIEI